ncbi:MAG: hypothetical protein AAF798_01200 [Bacteroidota bacterium]
MNPIYFWILLLTSSYYSPQPVDLNDQLFYWEDVENKFPFTCKKSILEFKDDTIRIIDFSVLGSVPQYQLGTYVLNKQKSSIECKIDKTVFLSTNMALVKSYTQDCGDEIYLRVENGTIIRKRESGLIRLDENGKFANTNELIKMIYNPISSDSIPIKYNWTKKLDFYANENNRKKCK